MRNWRECYGPIRCKKQPWITFTTRCGGSDYYERHLDLQGPAAGLNGDFALHHPEVIVSAENAIDMSDYFTRHPELLSPAESTDLSDYFQRH